MHKLKKPCILWFVPLRSFHTVFLRKRGRNTFLSRPSLLSYNFKTSQKFVAIHVTVEEIFQTSAILIDGFLLHVVLLPSSGCVASFQPLLYLARVRNDRFVLVFDDKVRYDRRMILFTYS